MKKKVLLILCLCLVLLAGGCSRNSAESSKENTTTKSGSDTKTDTKTDSNTDTKTEDTADETLATVTGMPEREEYKPSDYITLGKYKGIEISVVKTTVTDADVDSKIKSDLESTPSYKKTSKKTVEKGDIVNIDFEGIIDGKAFDGGTSKGYHLTIGSGSFIDGFEDGLIGKKVGKKVKLNLKFPDNYSNNTELAGKDVTFNVTINYIEKTVTTKLTDSYVKKNTDYKTVKEYKESVRTSLETSNETSIKNEKYNQAYSAVLNASKVSSVPESLSKYYTNVMNFQTYEVAKNQGIDVTEYLKNNNMTASQYNQYVASYVESYATQDLLIDAIAAAENLTISDDEISKTAKSYMTNYGYKTEEELYKVMPKSMIKESLLSTKVMDFVVKNAKITYTTPTPTPAATATPAASK